MTQLFFYLILKPVSLIPLRYTYWLSGPFFLVIYYLVGYRKKVVLSNLRRSFPEKDEEEIHRIARQSFRHLVDQTLEGIRWFSLTKREAFRRLQVGNPELLDRLYEAGRSVILVAGHYNSWELAARGMPLRLKHHIAGPYTPLSNTFMNRQLLKARSAFGMELFPKQEAVKWFARKHERPFAVFMVADQSPTLARNVHWTTFLNQETAVFFGPELFAKRYDLAVVFCHIAKTGRGRYCLEFELLEAHPARTPKGAITERHTRVLEHHIRKDPAPWLWTHKRWKRKQMDRGEA